MLDISMSVPEWLPSTPDEALRLQGQLPESAPAHLAAAAREAVSNTLKAGMAFTHYYRAGGGANAALVQKSVFLRYVAPQSPADGQGRLYWGEVSGESRQAGRRNLPL